MTEWLRFNWKSFIQKYIRQRAANTNSLQYLNSFVKKISNVIKEKERGGGEKLQSRKKPMESDEVSLAECESN